MIASTLGLETDLEAHSFCHAHNRVKGRVAFARQGFVKALAGNFGISGQRAHVAAFGNGAKRTRHVGGIAPFSSGFQVGSNVFFGLEVFGWIERRKRDWLCLAGFLGHYRHVNHSSQSVKAQ